jgi:predicted nicotinamide N-methyase
MPEHWAQEFEESEFSFSGGGCDQRRVAVRLHVVRPAAILAECNRADKVGSSAVNDVDTTGLAAWGLANTLSAYVAEHRALVAGKQVLELGCGRGMCGLVAAQCGAVRVVLSDYEPAVLALAQKNVAANAAVHAATGVQPTVEQLVWSRTPAECRSCGLFDLLLGSELLYHETDIPALIASTEHHLAKDGVSVMVYHARVWGITSSLKEAAAERAMSVQFVDIRSICSEEEASGDQLRGKYAAFLCRKAEARSALPPWLVGLRLVDATDEDNGEADDDSEPDSDGAGMQDLFDD